MHHVQQGAIPRVHPHPAPPCIASSRRWSSMHRRHGATALGIATAAVVTAALVTPVSSATAETGSRPAHAQAAPGSDHTPVGPDYNNGKPLKRDASLKKVVARQNSLQAQAAADAAVGDVATWLGLDDTTGSIYAKDYELRGIGKNIEVWVATNTTFPAGDCRNALGMTEVTDAQVTNFISEFDNNIYPKESASFSVPVPQDGANGQVGVGQVSPDQADDIVTLID